MTSSGVAEAAAALQRLKVSEEADVDWTRLMEMASSEAAVSFADGRATDTPSADLGSLSPPSPPGTRYGSGVPANWSPSTSVSASSLSSTGELWEPRFLRAGASPGGQGHTFLRLWHSEGQEDVATVSTIAVDALGGGIVALVGMANPLGTEASSTRRGAGARRCCAAFVAEELPKHLRRELGAICPKRPANRTTAAAPAPLVSIDLIRSAIEDAFLSTNEAYLTCLRGSGAVPMEGSLGEHGATVALALIVGHALFSAHLGDCKAVLCRGDVVGPNAADSGVTGGIPRLDLDNSPPAHVGGKPFRSESLDSEWGDVGSDLVAVTLTVPPHLPVYEGERRRILGAGGVIKPSAHGTLQLGAGHGCTRAFGVPGILGPGVTSMPDIGATLLKASDSLVVLGNAALFSHVSSHAACAAVLEAERHEVTGPVGLVQQSAVAADRRRRPGTSSATGATAIVVYLTPVEYAGGAARSSC